MSNKNNRGNTDVEGPLILYDKEYCWVLHNDSGLIELVEGPLRLTLQPNQTLHGEKRNKVVLKENEWVVVKNPFCSQTKQYAMGGRELRKGPSVFSLYPSEVLESAVQKAITLKSTQAAIVQALEDFEETTSTGETIVRRAGEKWNVIGPSVFIPTTSMNVVKITDAIVISKNSAIYVRNKRTAELRLITGPTTYVLAVNEELYYKMFSTAEKAALELRSGSTFNAPVINVQNNECICVIDYRENREKFIVGPESYILGPHEGVKVLSISGGVPKIEGQINIARIRFGPDFMNDSFTIRTKDNASLKVVVVYKWRFIVDDDLSKMFTSDFIGYACQSMRSRIREAAAACNFETFHTSSASILREALFKETEISTTVKGERKQMKMFGRYFKESSFLVFELDVKEVTPIDDEINELLNGAIKSNMQILCRKLNAAAQNEAEKENIESQAEIAKLKRNLIEIENANYVKANIGRAAIEGAALIEKAKAEKEASELLERSRMESQLARMRQTMDLLSKEGGDRYIEYVRALNLNRNVSSACVIPSNTKTLFLPMSMTQPEPIITETED